MTPRQAFKISIPIGFLAFYSCSALAAQPIQVECLAEFNPAAGGYQFEKEHSNEYIIPEGQKVGKVHYTQLPIFDESDPRENNWLFRWANRFHIETKSAVIESQSLIDADDRYDPRLVDETARLLRQRKYLYDADVRPVSQCGETVDLEVITRDVWSFTPEISFKRSGGENTYRFSLRDTNILGSGREVSVGVKKDLDRTSNEFFYKNNNMMGSRVAGRVRFSDNDDGSEQLVFVQLPFYSLDSRRAWRVRFHQFDRTDTQFFKSNEVTEVTHDREDYLLSYGFADGLKDGLVRRWALGYRFRDDTFGPGDELPPPEEFPIDRRLSYPFFEYSSVVDDYTTATNLNQIHRTEDLHLGHTLFTRLGYAASAFGSDSNRIVLEGRFDDTIIYDGNIFWRHKLEWTGLWNLDTDRSEDIIIDYRMRYFKNQTKHRSFFVNFNAVYTRNLNTNQQLFYGGDTGARGYQNRLQVGTRRVALSLEERLYSDVHLFNLFRLGWAIFVDVGKAWEPGVESGFEDDYLANIGFGLRLASTKATAGRVIHIDFAFPMTNRDDGEVNSSEISIKVKNEF